RRSVGKSGDREGGGGRQVVDGRSERGHHRHEVLVGGEGLVNPRSAPAVVQQRVDVAAGQDVGGPGVELGGPGRDGRVGAEVHAPQVVGQKTAPHHQDP